MGFLLGSTSCAVFVTRDSGRHGLVKKDNGNHNGWDKNQNNPHNPNHL